MIVFTRFMASIATLFVLYSAFNFVQASSSQILVNVVGNTIEVVQTVRQGRKVLKYSLNVMVDKVIYDRLYADFVDNRIDLQTDKLNRLPRWNRAVGKKLIDSELSFQWRMVHYLQSKRLGDRNRRLLERVKDSLFATAEAAKYRGNRTQRFFENLRYQRHALVRLRKRI